MTSRTSWRGATLAAACLLAMASAASAADYQKRVTGSCVQGSCSVPLAELAAGKTLRARFASCLLSISVPSGQELALTGSAISVFNPSHGGFVSEMLPLHKQSELRNGFTLANDLTFAANENIALTAGGGQKIQALISIGSGIQVNTLECQLSGVITP